MICNPSDVIESLTLPALPLQFDLERPFTATEIAGGPDAIASARKATVAVFMRRLKAFLSEVQDDQGCELMPGKNCQLCQSLYDIKFSAHVVVYLPEFTWQRTLMVAYTLNAQLVCLPDSESDRKLLVYTKANEEVSLVDLSIYNPGRCFRMLYNCKLMSPSPLKPTLGSSSRIARHDGP